MMGVPRKNWLEWTVFVIGLLCIIAVVTPLALEAVGQPATRADVIVRLGAPVDSGGKRKVPVTLVNTGGTAAVDVAVEVVLDRGNQPVERARVVIDLLPRQARREAWVAFHNVMSPGDRVRIGGVAFGEP